MQVLDAIQTRRTVHRFDPSQKVSEAALMRSLGAAHRAPCHYKTWPWRFYRLGPKARATLADAYVSYKSQRMHGGLGEAGHRRLRDKMMQAPELLVVTQVLADSEVRRKEDYAACAAALQNLQLCLAGDGVGSKWSTSGVMNSDAMYALLDVDRSVEEVIGLMLIGYPASEGVQPERPPLEDFIVRLP